jgi:transglutaminase-like putative cysteine protease
MFDYQELRMLGRFLLPLSSTLTLLTCAVDHRIESFRTAPTLPASDARLRRFEFTYAATVNQAPAGAETIDLWIPVAQDAPFQQVRVLSIEAPSGYQVAVEPTLGNQILHSRVPATALPVTVSVSYEVARREQKTDPDAPPSGVSLDADTRARFLAGSALVPVGPSVDAMAGGFRPTTSSSAAIGRQAYDHVLAQMRYGKEGTGWGTGSTEWACSSKYGNCTDFHAYFMSLTRTHGVPSRFLMGASIPTDKHEGEVAGYHCWAEFFVEGVGWMPVDISEADKVADTDPAMAEFYFGGLTRDRIEFSAGRDVPLVPPARSGPRNFFIYPYCEIDGKEAAKESLSRKFTFKDLG